MNKKKWFLLLLFSFTLIFMAACSSDDQSESNTISDSDMEMAVEDYAAQQEAYDEGGIRPEGPIDDGETDAPVDTTDRKIMYNANLELTTRKYDTAVQFIEEETNRVDGYILNKETHRYDAHFRSGYFTIRIPAENLQAFLNQFETDLFKVEYNAISGQDVTDQYVDLETRLNTQKQLEERLLTFMEEAKSTEDLLQISRDLANVQLEIERLTGQLNYLDNRIDYATVDLRLQEEEVSTLKEGDLNIWQRTKDQWVRSYDAVIIFFSNLFVNIVGNLPVIIIFIVIASVVGVFVRRRNKKQSQPHHSLRDKDKQDTDQ